MNPKVTASAKTFFKSMIWYGVAACIDYALNHLAGLNLPLWIVPIVGFALKAAATWVATQRK